MQHTRQQIIDYLQANRMATSIEMSHVFLVTPANIRHHLKLLIKSGLVQEIGKEPVRGRGRPTKLYSLTENALKHNLTGLTSALLTTLSKNQSEMNETLSQTAIHLLGDHPTSSSAHIQLNHAVEKLNQLKYQASWEASPNGPKIILRNCPYALILPEHPELCNLDVALLSKLLQRPFEQIAKLRKGSRWISSLCLYYSRPCSASMKGCQRIGCKI